LTFLRFNVRDLNASAMVTVGSTNEIVCNETNDCWEQQRTRGKLQGSLQPSRQLEIVRS
jgi:hypothetical protein